MANAELALEAKNTLPSSFESGRRGKFPSPTGLPSTPRSPVSKINRIRPASPLQTGLVQPWVQSEGSCLASATPLNVLSVNFDVCKISSVSIDHKNPIAPSHVRWQGISNPECYVIGFDFGTPTIDWDLQFFCFFFDSSQCLFFRDCRRRVA